MNEKRRPSPAESKPASTEDVPSEETDFFGSDEHDGWGPIEKRRPTEAPKSR